MKKVAIIFILGWFISNSMVMAQSPSNCANTLYDAHKAYEAGRFAAAMQMLQPCLTHGFSKEEKSEGYRLLALCYLNVDQIDSAERSIKRMLRYKPEYKKFPYVDPVNFSRLLDNFSVQPKLEIGVFSGVKLSSVNPITNYSVSGSEAVFNPEMGSKLGVSVEYYCNKRLSIATFLMNDIINYSRTADNVGGWNQTYKERLSYFSLPLQAKYYLIQKNKFSCNASLGYQWSWLLSSYANILMTKTDGEKMQNTIDRKPQRSKAFGSIQTGAQLKYKAGIGDASILLGYQIGLKNIVNPANRYDNPEFILGNQYIDSDFKMNAFTFAVSYQLPVSFTIKQNK